MRLIFTRQADAWFDAEPSDLVRQTVVDWLWGLFDTSPDPDDWVGAPLEDEVSLMAFVPGVDVAVTYCTWPEGGAIFIDIIEPIPTFEA
jgi:hypothetical protein